MNIPLGERSALRVMGFYKRDGGYIDNVLGGHTFSRSNIRAGLPEDSPLRAIAADVTVTNEDVVEENFNEATTFGGRAALRIDLNDSWTFTAGAMFQDVDREGVWDHDPTIGDLQVMLLLPEKLEDRWSQYSAKIEGELFGGTLMATAAIPVSPASSAARSTASYMARAPWAWSASSMPVPGLMRVKVTCGFPFSLPPRSAA